MFAVIEKKKKLKFAILYMQTGFKGIYKTCLLQKK